MIDCDSERIWKIVEAQRTNVPKKKRQLGSSLSLFDRLYDCYVECNQALLDKSADKRFRSTVNLLQRVDPDSARVSLVISLYSDERGYSLMLCPSGDGETEEIFLPYEDNEIFSYLDNQEIPPVLLEVLEKTQYCHLYGGCVVCEVRDYRNSPQVGDYEKHLLLLRPTQETLLATVNEIAHENKCSPEEKLYLESRLLLATQPPICLDPSTDVVCVTNRLQYNRRKFHTHAMRRYLRRRSQASRSRMAMLAGSVAPEGLQLHDFLLQKRADGKRIRSVDHADSWKRPKLDMPHLCNPAEIARDVFQHARVVTEKDQPPAAPSGETIQEQPQSLTRLHEKKEMTTLERNLPPATPTLTSVEELLDKGSQAVSQPAVTTTPLSSVQQTAAQVAPQPTLHSPPPTLPPKLTAFPPGVRITLPNDPAILRRIIQQHQANQPIVVATPAREKGGSSSRLPRPIAPAVSHMGIRPTMPPVVHLTKYIPRQPPGQNPRLSLGVSSSAPLFPTANVVVTPVARQPRTKGPAIVVVSRPSGTRGQQGAPGIVSVQQVPASTMVQARAGSATPPLKGPPSAPSPPTLHPPSKPPALTSPALVQTAAGMPKLTKLQQPSPSPLAIQRPMPMPQLHSLHKMAVPSAQVGKTTSPQLLKMAPAASNVPQSLKVTSSPSGTAISPTVQAARARQAPPQPLTNIYLSRQPSSSAGGGSSGKQ